MNEKRGMGTITREDFERLASEIKAKRRPCPLCGEDNWVFGSQYVNLWSKATEGEEQPLNFLVLLPMICRSCGNTHLLFPNYLGVEVMDLVLGDKEVGPEET